jgi:A/G-specific adenine glycosylase
MASTPRARSAAPDTHRDPASRIAAWQLQAGRHGLPWQHTTDPYRIWLSETMLQQTQATTVIPYYERFLTLFPDIAALADAPVDAVLLAWAGLGYYARARNLHRCARVLCDAHGGRFPESSAALAELPGIGPSTAAAIAAFAWGERSPILDGNVRRVLARHQAVDGDPSAGPTVRRLWDLAHAWLDAAPADLDMRAYTQGQMDLGAMICTRTRPDCSRCPLADDCEARRLGRQDELPAPRARRAQPQRHCLLLIAECDSHVLLQRRPDSGLWGGLWTLPQYADDQALTQACASLPDASGPLQALAAIDHTFTHFHLHMRPFWLRIAGPLPPQAPPGQTWVRLDALQSHGMPAPVSRLLAGLFEDAPARP